MPPPKKSKTTAPKSEQIDSVNLDPLDSIFRDMGKGPVPKRPKRPIIIFERDRSLEAKKGWEEYRKLLTRAVELGYNPLNKRRVAKSVLDKYIEENQYAKIEFKSYPRFKQSREYQVVLDIYGDKELDASVASKKPQLNNFRRIHQNFVVQVSTRLNLIKLLKPGTVIARYDENGVENPLWEEFFYLIDADDEWMSRLDSLLRDTRIIRVVSVSLDQSIKKTFVPKDLLTKKPQRDDTSLTLSHPYIDINYDREKAKKDPRFLFVQKFDQDYINQNWKEGACFLTMIIEAYKTSWDRNTPKKPLTYESLKSLFNLDDGDLGLLFEIAIEKFFKPFRLGLTVYDIMGEIILQYTPSKKNTSLSPLNFRCITANGHLQMVNSKTTQKRLAKLESLISDSLSQDNKGEEEASFELRVSDKFNLYKEDKNPVQNFYIAEFERINEIDFENLETETIKVVTTTPLHIVLSTLVRDYKFLPQNIRCSRNDLVSSIYLKIFDKRVEILNPDNDTLLGELQFIDQQQMDTYYNLKQKLNSQLFSYKNLSEYNEIELLKSLSPRPMVCKLTSDSLHSSDSSVVPNYYVDLIKSYTSILSRIHYFPQINQFDRFTPFVYTAKGEAEIDPSFFYIIRRAEGVDIPKMFKDTVLSQKFTIYYGQHLSEMLISHNCLLDLFTIEAELRTSNKTKNELSHIIKEIYEDKFLSETHKKFICNSSIGMTGKTLNKKKKVLLVQDYCEALLHSRKYKCKMFPFHLTSEKTIIGDNNPFEGSRDPEGSDLGITGPSPRLYTVQKEVQTPLKNGFYPIQLAVYSGQRVELLKMYQKVLKKGGIPTAINTDCIFFYSPATPNEIEGSEGSESRESESLFKNIGKLKWRKIVDEVVPKKIFKDTTEQMTAIKLYEQKPPLLQTLENESSYKTNPEIYNTESFTILDRNNLNLVQGSQAGAGKTTLCCRYLKHLSSKGFKYIAVGPSNKRIFTLQKENELDKDLVLTIHQLLQLRLDEDKKTIDSRLCKKNLLHDLDVLFVDEIFAFDTKTLGMIKTRIIDRYPNIRIIASGDAVQSRVSDVQNMTSTETDQYYRRVVYSMFKTGISLQINKRMEDNGGEKLEDVKSYLFSAVKGSSASSLRSSVIPHLSYFSDMSDLFSRHFRGETFTGAVVCYHLDTVETVGRLIHSEFMRRNPQIHFKKVNGMYLYPGQELINRDHKIICGLTLHVNYSYIVQSVETGEIEVRGKDKNGKKGRGKRETVESTIVRMKCPQTGDLFFIPHKCIESFRYPYAITIHSSQGDTYRDVPLSIFDFDSPWIKPNDKYTAISRSNSLDLVQIYNGQSMKICIHRLREKIERRIESHKSTDIKANRNFDAESRGSKSQGSDEYVTVEWVLERFNSTNFLCPHCNSNYSLTHSIGMKDFSIDRIDDNFAHTIKNCVVGCRGCNVSRSKTNIRSSINKE